MSDDKSQEVRDVIFQAVQHEIPIWEAQQKIEAILSGQELMGKHEWNYPKPKEQEDEE
jgi:hypothetical protein